MRTRQNPLFAELAGDDVAPNFAPTLRKNPLKSKSAKVLVEVDRLAASTTLTRRKRTMRRELRDQRRLDCAAGALEGFGPDVEIVGYTKGQFSLIQLITEALRHTGPADLVISTWTAANADVTEVLQFCDIGLAKSARWLVDLTFSKRSPQLAQRIRDVFGGDAIRVAKNHAKFVLLANDRWRVVIRTSMNLNHNPRFENFDIAHDPELYGFHAAIIDEIWAKQGRVVEQMRPYEIEKHFQEEL
jgi:hypothetical protein